MKEIRNPKMMTRQVVRLKHSGRTIGFVPTMGALHEGHMSLIRAAKKENDVVIASIFVNPTQFGPKEDYKKYPRPAREDRRKLTTEKVDFLFYPSVRSMYPPTDTVSIEPDKQLTQVLCGKFRPGHFRGVASVVAKLFNIVQPDHVYFGAKDYQQSVIIERLIKDLNIPVGFHRQPTVREKDGLAMSSRNQFLSPEERVRARTISQTLFWVRDQVRATRRSLLHIRRDALKKLPVSAFPI